MDEGIPSVPKRCWSAKVLLLEATSFTQAGAGSERDLCGCLLSTWLEVSNTKRPFKSHRFASVFLGPTRHLSSCSTLLSFWWRSRLWPSQRKTESLSSPKKLQVGSSPNLCMEFVLLLGTNFRRFKMLFVLHWSDALLSTRGSKGREYYSARALRLDVFWLFFPRPMYLQYAWHMTMEHFGRYIENPKIMAMWDSSRQHDAKDATQQLLEAEELPKESGELGGVRSFHMENHI